MLLPFQCVLIRSIGETEVLLAASGSYVYTFNLKCGSVLSTWHSDCNLFSGGSSTPQIQSSKPSPKLQNSPSNENVESSPKSRLEDGNFKSIDTENSNFVIKLAGSSNGQHIIAVTEDKCVHVLRLSADGALIQLSQR